MAQQVLIRASSDTTGMPPPLALASVALVILLGVFVRCWQIGYNFDADEVFTVRLASEPFAAMIAGAMADTPHPPLHILLLHFWSKAFGTSEVAARALSVLLSAGFLIVGWRLLRRWLGHWIALGMLAVLALSPLFVLYGQQARPYALIAFLAAVNLWTFLRFLDVQEQRRIGFLWAASCAALLYAQYMGMLFIAVTALYGMMVRPDRRVAIAGFGALGCAAIVPWALIAMWTSISTLTDPLPQIDWITVPGFEDFGRYFVSIFGDSPPMRDRWLLLLLAVLAAGYLVRAVRVRQVHAEHLLLIALAVVLPLAVYLLSVIGSKPIFASRQLLGPALAFVACVGLCAAALPRPWGYLAVIVLLSWTVLGVREGLPEHVKPPWRAVAEHIDTGYPTRATVVSEWWVSVPLRYYVRGTVTEIADYAGEPALYLCRPIRCDDALFSPAFAGRAKLVRKWPWGGGELALYEIAAR